MEFLHGSKTRSNPMHPLFALGLPGFSELMIILIVVLVLFGAKRLPELARGLGSSVKELRKAKEEFDQESLERNRKAAAPKDGKTPPAAASRTELLEQA